MPQKNPAHFVLYFCFAVRCIEPTLPIFPQFPQKNFFNKKNTKQTLQKKRLL